LAGQLCVDHPAAGLAQVVRSACTAGLHPGEAPWPPLASPQLEAGCPVYPANPKTVDRHRRAAGAKTDAIDPRLLAGHVRREQRASG